MKKTKTIGCEEAIKHLLPYLDHDLKKKQEQKIAQHLSVCRTCKSRSDFEQHLFEQHLKEQLRKSGDAVVQPELKMRIKNILGRF